MLETDVSLVFRSKLKRTCFLVLMQSLTRRNDQVVV